MGINNKSSTNGRQLGSQKRPLHFGIQNVILHLHCCCCTLAPLKQWLHCYFLLMNIEKISSCLHKKEFENHQEEKNCFLDTIYIDHQFAEKAYTSASSKNWTALLSQEINQKFMQSVVPVDHHLENLKSSPDKDPWPLGEVQPISYHLSIPHLAAAGAGWWHF